MQDKRSSDDVHHPLLKSVHHAKRRGLTLFAVLVTAVSLVLVIGATLDLPDNHPASTPTAAPNTSHPAASLNISGVLRQAGTAAGSQPGGWPQASYWHSVSSYRKGSGPPVRREAWAGHRGIGALVDTRLSSAVIPLQDGRFAGLGWDELYALPTESGALDKHLRATSLDGIRDEDTELFALAGALLRESPAPPTLRKALWEVVARVPEVSLVGAVKDGSGRPGVAIEHGVRGYVLDPTNGRLLEEYIAAPRPASGSPGDASWRATYLEQGPAVSAPPTTPATVRLSQSPVPGSSATTE